MSGLVYAKTEADFVVYSDYKKFDFGVTGANLTLANWIHVNASMTSNIVFSADYGYGFLSAVTVDARDRATGTNLTRDIAQATGTTLANFSVAVPSTYENVTLYVGDMSYAHTGMDFYLENQLVWDSVSTNAGEIKIESFNVTISDGILTVSIANDAVGGTTTIAGLEVQQGMVNATAWLQYQIDNLPTPESREYTDDDLMGLAAFAVVMALTAFAVAVAVILRRRKNE